jgi:hypothetical protein
MKRKESDLVFEQRMKCGGENVALWEKVRDREGQVDRAVLIALAFLIPPGEWAKLLANAVKDVQDDKAATLAKLKRIAEGN